MKVYIKVLLLLLLAAGMTWIQSKPQVKRNGLNEVVDQSETRICGHCGYWHDGNCSRHDRSMVSFNAYACAQWSI